METVALRYFNVFGPRQDPASQYSAVIPKFITAILRQNAPVIFGDGEQTRDFTFVQNVVSANLLAAEAPNAGGGVMNVACHERISLNTLVADINRLTGNSVVAEYAPPRLGDVLHSFAAIERASEIIGYSPVVPWSEGLARTVGYYRGI
jgi:UDP-glucose 4-epimerase